jgi:hypothetical protein
LRVLKEAYSVGAVVVVGKIEQKALLLVLAGSVIYETKSTTDAPRRWSASPGPIAEVVPLHQLAQIMGHDSLDTTMLYVCGTKQDLQQDVEKIAWI